MTGFIINPGSRIHASSGDGWTNTYEGAVKEAQRWLKELRDDHIADVELVLPGVPGEWGRWVFGFRHKVTGVTVSLETHGIDDWRAYEKQCVFSPKVYWNGSSCGQPQVEDWAAPAFTAIKTFRQD
ncbi:hypothetical protein C8D88_116109 [Lentzea atacamensis]|uniref:Uncharacterized protein n=1 Tax=Lentzea atacamensis TaxID=531938 RepID=A0A316HNW1_9PSEU|nr:hypothetical protein [Lentzea atacamensis]PWK81698.1 hypothetical protein C8D88_116109 [Lentzea atacamensis]